MYILQNLWHPIHAWYIFYFDPFSFNVILSHEKSKSIDFHLKINKQKKFENHIKKKTLAQPISMKRGALQS